MEDGQVRRHVCGKRGDEIVACRAEDCTHNMVEALMDETVTVAESRVGRGVGLFVHAAWAAEQAGGCVVATGGVAATREGGGYTPCREGCDLVFCAKEAVPAEMEAPYGIDRVYARGGVVSGGQIRAVPGTNMPQIVLTKERWERFLRLREELGMAVPERVEVVVDWGEGAYSEQRQAFVAKFNGMPVPRLGEKLVTGGKKRRAFQGGGEVARMPVSAVDGRVRHIAVPIAALGMKNTVIWAGECYAAGMKHVPGVGHAYEKVAESMEKRGQGWRAIFWDGSSSKFVEVTSAAGGERTDGFELQVLMAAPKAPAPPAPAPPERKRTQVAERRAENRRKRRADTSAEGEHQLGYQRWAEEAIMALNRDFTLDDVEERVNGMFPEVRKRLIKCQLKYSMFVPRDAEISAEEANAEFSRKLKQAVWMVCGAAGENGIIDGEAARAGIERRMGKKRKRMATIVGRGVTVTALDAVVEGLKRLGGEGTVAEIAGKVAEWEPRLGECKAVLRNQLNNLIARRSSVFRAVRRGRQNVYSMGGEGAAGVLREIGCTVEL